MDTASAAARLRAMKHTTFAALAAALAFAGAAPAQPAPTASLENKHPAGLDLAGMDRAVRPGDDFFAYGNGGWMKATEIPPDRSQWGTAGELVELTPARVQDLIESEAAAPARTEARTIRHYHSSHRDHAKTDAPRLTPLQPPLPRIS